MTHRFQAHDTRLGWDLDGVWDFAYLGDADPDSIDVARLAFPERMAVPGCFDATPAYAGKRGLAAYRARLFFPEAGRYRLIFGGVNHWCSVWVGGEKRAEHGGGSARFSVDITAQQPGEADLVVLVDNRFDPLRSPLHYEFYDWYHYGGIARPVRMERLGDLWIENLRAVTEDYLTRRVTVAIEYTALTYPQQADLVLSFDGQVVLAEKVQIDSPSGMFHRELAFPEAALWSPRQPALHALHARLGSDDLRARIGIRQVQAAGRDILINGEPVQLLGFNRHEAHPQFGSALPEQIMVSDVQQFLDLGCNFVRGSHYPQDERFLDLCDEAGICVWNEITGWQNTVEHLTDPRFLAAQKQQAAEMVAMSFNHPSVILYGLLNESVSNDPDAGPGYEEIISTLRGLDPTRLITYASNHPMDDLCLALADVISINAYPGWYEGSIEEIPARIGAIMDRIDQAGSQEKPCIISEIGAEGIYGWRDWNETRWSEQYQARLLEMVIRHLFIEPMENKHPSLAAGISIWLFSDFRTSQGLPRILGRGRGFNNKGVVDEYRRPKQAYDTVRDLFHHIGKIAQENNW